MTLEQRRKAATDLICRVSDVLNGEKDPEIVFALTVCLGACLDTLPERAREYVLDMLSEPGKTKQDC